MADHRLKQAQAPRLQVTGQSQILPFPGTAAGETGDADTNGRNGDLPAGHPVLHLGELVGVIRERLEIDPSLTDDQIIGSLIEISARADMRARWLTAFNSTLGRWLVLRGSDLNTSLNTVLMLLPPART